MFLMLGLLMGFFVCPKVWAEQVYGRSMEQIFGLLGDLSVYGNFGKGSPWLYETDLLLAGNQIGSLSTSSNQTVVFSAAGSYNAIGYQIDAHQAIYAGFGFQHVLQPLASIPTNEYRGWQQYNREFFTDVGGFKWVSRLEERTVNNGPGMAMRVRQLGQWSYPLNDVWYLIGIEEVFLNLNTVSWGPAAGFDQNRLFVGVGYRFSEMTRAEIGYLNNFINRDLVSDLDVSFMTFNVYVDLTE